MKDLSYEKSHHATLTYLRRASRFLKLTKILGTVVGAALVALSPWISEMEGPHAAALGDLALWVGLAFTVTGSLVLVFVDQTTPEVLSENLTLCRESDVNQLKFTYLLDYIDHTLARVSLNSYLREIVEAAVTDGCESEEKLKEFCEAILGLLVSRKASLFSIGDEDWNFAVYEHLRGDGQLVCVACKRSGDLTANHEHRSWKVGEGHVGLTFSRSTELIFADATSDELRPVIGAQGDQYRNYDENRYKSLASMPISTDGDHPLGILIATSSVVGRYKSESERSEKDWDREDVLREVAAYLAILFKLTHGEKKSSGDSNDTNTGDQS